MFFLSILEETPEVNFTISLTVSLLTRGYFGGMIIGIKDRLPFSEAHYDAMRRKWNESGSTV